MVRMSAMIPSAPPRTWGPRRGRSARRSCSTKLEWATPVAPATACTLYFPGAAMARAKASLGACGLERIAEVPALHALAAKQAFELAHLVLGPAHAAEWRDLLVGPYSPPWPPSDMWPLPWNKELGETPWSCATAEIIVRGCNGSSTNRPTAHGSLLKGPIDASRASDHPSRRGREPVRGPA